VEEWNFSNNHAKWKNEDTENRKQKEKKKIKEKRIKSFRISEDNDNDEDDDEASNIYDFNKIQNIKETNTYSSNNSFLSSYLHHMINFY
jgi:hypothetical protein